MRNHTSRNGQNIKLHEAHGKSAQNSPEKLSGVVMLGPPNKGSQVADKLQSWDMFRWVNGPAGQQLSTDPQSFCNQLPAANFNLGIIAGTKTFNPILSQMLPNPDDGKVTVENTKVDGMKDFIALPVTHTFMMKNKKVIKQVIGVCHQGRTAEAGNISLGIT